MPQVADSITTASAAFDPFARYGVTDPVLMIDAERRRFVARWESAQDIADRAELAGSPYRPTLQCRANSILDDLDAVECLMLSTTATSRAGIEAQIDRLGEYLASERTYDQVMAIIATIAAGVSAVAVGEKGGN